MTRLEYYRTFDYASEGLIPIDFPEDVQIIKAKVPELANERDVVVQCLYSDWGEETMCAGWLMLQYADLDCFKNWCLSEEK